MIYKKEIYEMNSKLYEQFLVAFIETHKADTFEHFL